MTQTPDALVQWKGTDLCMDFHCTCGAHSHFDGMFCSIYKCPSCGRRWKMPTDLSPAPAADDDPAPERSGDLEGGEGEAEPPDSDGGGTLSCGADPTNVSPLVLGHSSRIAGGDPMSGKGVFIALHAAHPSFPDRASPCQGRPRPSATAERKPDARDDSTSLEENGNG